MSENSALFQRIAVHPSTNFPGRTQENTLGLLLRKKLEPSLENLVEEGREAAQAAGLDVSKLGDAKLGGGGGRFGGSYDDDDDNDDYGLDQEGDVPSDPFNEQWADIRDACFDGIKDYIENQAREPYTLAEQEMGTKNVRTGLRRSLEDDSDEEDDDEDEEMAGVAKGGVSQAPATSNPAGGSLGLRPEHAMWFAGRGNTQLPPFLDPTKRQKAV
jgi:mediator of RNA polymerase II transcription subunit 8